MNLSDLRQFRYPKAFRIERPHLRPELSSLGVLLREQPTRASLEGLAFKEQCKLVSRIATELWRLRQKMIDAERCDPKQEMRKPLRHVMSALDALSEAGVEIQVHTGQPYRTGLAVEVLAFQPTAEIAREMMIETIRPSVYLSDKQIQQGQVIVGTPLDRE